MAGWIKLHRSLIEWEWYTDHHACRLFIHCLLRANHSDTKWRGQELLRGQFITSLESLSGETGLSISQVRTSLTKLISTDEIASLSQARSRVITVVQYESYQSDDKLPDKLIASSSQADRKLLATDKNVKNVKNEININPKEKNKRSAKEKFNPKNNVPDGVNIGSWIEWIDYRKAKGKSVSEAAAEKQIKFLLTYDQATQKRIIDKSISSDYQGLFEPKDSSYEINQPTGTPAGRRLSAVERIEENVRQRQLERESRNSGTIRDIN